MGDTTEHNRRAVGTYLEFRASSLETSSQISEEPFDRKARGSSRPPVPHKGFEFMDEGLTFTKGSGNLQQAVSYFDALKYQSTLNTIIEAYRTGIERHRGIPYSVVVDAIWSDPAAIRKWLAAETPDDRQMRAAFNVLCYRIARDFAQLYPDVRITVTVSEAAKMARKKTREAQKEHTRQTNERIVSELVEIEAYEECSRKAAMGILQDKAKAGGRDISVRRIRRAIEETNREGAA